MTPGSYMGIWLRQSDVALPGAEPTPTAKVVGRLQGGMPEVAIRLTYLYRGRRGRAIYHFYVPVTNEHETTSRLIELLATHGTRSVRFRGVAFEDAELWLDYEVVPTAIQCLREAADCVAGEGESDA